MKSKKNTMAKTFILTQDNTNSTSKQVALCIAGDTDHAEFVLNKMKDGTWSVCSEYNTMNDLRTEVEDSDSGVVMLEL